MKNLDRYTLTALWLADFLNDDIRRIILNTSKCTSLTEADNQLDEFVAACKTASHNVLVTNPAAMAKISDDARMFGFAESELSRRLNIKDGDHTDKLTVITWDYTEMQLFMLSGIDPAEKKLQSKLLGKLYDKAKIGFRTLVSALISRGCYAEIGGKIHKYEFFAASAGQMRKQRFVLLRNDMYSRHNEALTLGLSEGKTSDGIIINASKWLPYKALCLSSGRKEEWFDLDKCIVIPDHSINLTAVVDTVSENYDIIHNKDGAAVLPRTLEETLENMCAAVGIRKIGVHALRHTYATRLFEKGVDIKIISELLGHSSTEITYRIYVHVIDSLKEAAAEALDLD